MVNARAKGRASKAKPRTYTWQGEMAGTWCMRDRHGQCTGRMRSNGGSGPGDVACGCGCHKLTHKPTQRELG